MKVKILKELLGKFDDEQEAFVLDEAGMALLEFNVLKGFLCKTDYGLDVRLKEVVEDRGDGIEYKFDKPCVVFAFWR